MGVNITDKQKQEDQGTFVMTGLTIIMTGTLFIYFLWAVLNQNFLVNFSIDAIVGVIALVLLIKNLAMKYEMLKKYGVERDFLFLDVLGLLLCVLVKLVAPKPFDFSLVILLFSYYMSKNRFKKILLA